MKDKLKRALVWLKFHLYQDDFTLFLFFCLILLLLMLAGCKSPKHLTDETIIHYKDSTIVTYKDSTIFVEVPKERIVDIVPIYDTLHLETSLADATAYVDTTTHSIKGSLENKKDAVLTKVVYLPSEEHIVYKDSIVKKPYPVYVDKVKYRTPKWIVWLLSGLATLVIIAYRKYIVKLIKLIATVF